MRAASFEATEGLDALADAEIANGKDVGKARAAALVVGRKKGNGVEADGRGEGGDENPTTEEVQEGGQRQISEDGGEETAMEKRLWLWILSNGERRQGSEEEGRRRGRTRDRKTMVWGRNRGMEERKKNRATALAVAAMKRRTKTGAERGRWIRGRRRSRGRRVGEGAVEDREGAAVLAVEGEEGREGVGGDQRQHWLLPKVLNRERKRRRGGEEAKRKEKIGLLAFKLTSKTKIFIRWLRLGRQKTYSRIQITHTWKFININTIEAPANANI